MTEDDVMVRAIVCLPSLSTSTLSGVISILSTVNPKTFKSVDEGFEYLWDDGRDVKLFVLDLEESYVEELWTCARGWPDLHFIALHECSEILPDPVENILLVSRKDNDPEMLGALREIITPQVSRVIGY